MDKLNIAHEMKCFDLKDRSFYRDLTTEERKKFSNYLMIRWGSAVAGSRDLQEFYVISCNQRFNRHFFAINRHPELQWLCATTVSPGMGTHRHSWIAPKKKEAGASTVKKQLLQLFPNMKSDEVDLMARLNSKADIAQYLKSLGQDA